MSKISRHNYDQLAAFVASVKDSVFLRVDGLRNKIYGLYIQPYEAFEKRMAKCLLGWDFDGNWYSWLRDGTEESNMVNITDLFVETTVTKFEQLPKDTPTQTVLDLAESGILCIDSILGNRVVNARSVPECGEFIGMAKIGDKWHGFVALDATDFYKKTETTVRVPFEEAFKQFQANALNE